MNIQDNPYLNGQILLAMPGMGDPRFQKAVIYICAHDSGGAMGIMVNQNLPGLQFGKLVGQLGIASDIQIPQNLIDLPVMAGGPVESARGFVLHSSDFSEADTIKINDDFSVTGTIDALQTIANGDGPKKMIFALGYAGWSAGQLDNELKENAWLVAKATPQLLFETDSTKMWEKAVQGLGIDPALLSQEAGQA